MADDYTINNIQIDYLSSARSVNEDDPSPSSSCPFYKCDCSKWVTMRVSEVNGHNTLVLAVTPRTTAIQGG